MAENRRRVPLAHAAARRVVLFDQGAAVDATILAGYPARDMANLGAA